MQNEMIYTKVSVIGNFEALKYFITRHGLDSGNVIYEIGIEKMQDGMVVEKEVTGGLTKDYQQAVEFLNKLHRNKITPMCLLEVTDDCFYANI